MTASDFFHVDEELLCKFLGELLDAGLESVLIKQIDALFSAPAYDNIGQQLVTALPEASIVGPQSLLDPGRHMQELSCNGYFQQNLLPVHCFVNFGTKLQMRPLSYHLCQHQATFSTIMLKCNLHNALSGKRRA